MIHSRLLLDTNVVLDLLLARAPFDQDAIALTSLVTQGAVGASLCATTLTTIHYLTRKQLGEARARDAIQKLLDIFDVAPVTELVLRDALLAGFKDFEDAVVDAAARHAGVSAIVTRDSAGFLQSQLSIFRPDEMLAALAAQ